jgi:hypothetical protein
MGTAFLDSCFLHILFRVGLLPIQIHNINPYTCFGIYEIDLHSITEM